MSLACRLLAERVCCQAVSLSWLHVAGSAPLTVASKCLLKLSFLAARGEQPPNFSHPVLLEASLAPHQCRCRCMAASSLQPLLEGAGLHALVSHVLPLLSPHELGRLSASCSRLRTVVAGLPEATWQACAWRSQPHPQHPIHSAASCRAYLRRQHAAHTAISSGRSSVTTAPAGLYTVLAPDLSRHAVVHRASLQLLDAATHRESARYELPWNSSWGGPQWDSSGSCIALPWGANWCGEEDVDLGEPTRTGLCILHLQTGGLTHIDLGMQSACCIFGGFTQAGSIVVRQIRAVSESGASLTLLERSSTARLPALAAVHTILQRRWSWRQQGRMLQHT